MRRYTGTVVRSFGSVAGLSPQSISAGTLMSIILPRIKQVRPNPQEVSREAQDILTNQIAEDAPIVALTSKRFNSDLELPAKLRIRTRIIFLFLLKAALAFAVG